MKSNHAVRSVRVPRRTFRTTGLSALLCGCAVLLSGIVGGRADTVFRPGLFQGQYNCSSRQYPDRTVDLRSLDSSATDRMAGSVMADTTSSWVSPVSGLTWTWAANTTYGYEGYMYLVAGTEVQVWQCNDDGVILEVDGDTILINGSASTSGYDAGVQKRAFSVAQTGWYPVKIWSYNWSGGSGPVSGKSGVSYMGIGWNTNGCTTVNKAAIDGGQWNYFRDAGDMRLLKTPTDESFLTVSYSIQADGTKVLTAEGTAPTNSILTLVPESGRPWEYLEDQAVVLAEIPAGDFSTDITLTAEQTEGLDTVRACLRTPPGVSSLTDAYEAWSDSFTVAGTPLHTLEITAIGATSVMLALNVESLGSGGTSATAYADFSADETFASPVTVAAAEPITTAPTVYTLAVAPGTLSTSTVYYVRTRLVSDVGLTGTSAVQTFTTGTPGTPVLKEALAVTPAYDGCRAQFYLESSGTVCTNAAVQLEVSETEDFAAFEVAETQTVSEDRLPALMTLTFSGASAGAARYVRARVTNEWGFEALTETVGFETEAGPFTTSAISILEQESGVDFSLEVLTLVSGTTLDVELTVESDGFYVIGGTWTGLTSVPAVLSKNLSLTPSSSSYTVTYTLKATLQDGTVYTGTRSQVYVPGSNIYALSDAATLSDARYDAGDVICLPPLGTQYDAYEVVNPSVAEYDAESNSLKALAPGGTAVYIHRYDAETGEVVSEQTAIIVKPEPIGDGRVFLFRGASSGAVWTDAANWECLSHPADSGFPNGTGDIAMFLFDSTGTKRITVGSDGNPTITLGGLYAGMIRDVGTVEFYLDEPSNGSERTLQFARTDGEPVLIQLTGGSTSSRRFLMSFGRTGSTTTTRLNLTCGSDVVVHGGYTGDDPTYMGNFHRFLSVNVSLNGHTWKLTDFCPNGYSWGSHETFNLSATCNLIGDGVLWNDSAVTVAVWADCSAFTGTFRESGVGHTNYDRSGNFQIHTDTVQQARLEIHGYDPTKTMNTSLPSIAGLAVWGTSHSYGAAGVCENRIPGRGVFAEGGQFLFRTEAVTAYGGDSENINEFSSLELGRGTTKIAVAGHTNQSYPTNTVIVNKITRQASSALYLYAQDSVDDNPKQKCRLTFTDVDEYLTGAGGNPKTGTTYSVIPWMAQYSSSNREISFAAFDESGRLVQPSLVNQTLDSVTDPDTIFYTSRQGLSLTQDRTVQAAYIRYMNAAGLARFGAGRTLTITSGMLILGFPDNMIGTADGGEANGTLVFGNRAYLWQANYADNGQSEIYVPMIAPQGMVICNALTALVVGGDQGGIEGDITLNNGTLELGSRDGTCPAVLGDITLRIVSGGSKVILNSPGSLLHTTVHFDDVGRFKGKLDIPEGSVEVCQQLFIGSGERSMPAGTYGATGSGAETIDDEHFSGLGVLKVRSDNLQNYTVILLR